MDKDKALYVAECACGWKSTAYDTEAQAVSDANMHAITTNHGTTETPLDVVEVTDVVEDTPQDANPVPEDNGTPLATPGEGEPCPDQAEDPLCLPSLAGEQGSGKVYYRANLREYTATSMRVQVQKPGKVYHSEHGIPVPADFLSWLMCQPHTKGSMAGSGKMYVAGQVRLCGGVVRFQVAGTPYNRLYGAAFTLEAHDLVLYLQD